MNKILLCIAVTLMAGPCAFATTSGEISLHKAAARLLNKVGSLEKKGDACKLVFEKDNLGERFKIVSTSENESFAGFPVSGPNERGAVEGGGGTWTIKSSTPNSPDEGQRGHAETYTISIGADFVSIKGDGISATCDIR